MADPPDVLVTNLRLEEYNGLHLVVLAAESGAATRCVVHTDRPDFYLAREAQSARRVLRADTAIAVQPAFIHPGCPAAERSPDPLRYDRRTALRGGRRSADVTEAIAGA